MNRWIFALAALAALASTALAGSSEKKIVCYFGSWAVYRPGDGKFNVEDIDPLLCTHLIFTFVGITSEGGVRVLDAWNELPDNWGKDAFGRFNKLRDRNPNVKTLIAIGGWNEGSARYSEVAASPAKRNAFVNNVVEFLQKYDFDGFDFDWEYPNQRGGKPEDVKNFSILLKELKTAFTKYGYILSAAVGAAEPSASQSYDIAEICKWLDFVNIMAYDLHGSWEKQTGHNAPLYPRTGESGNDLKLNVHACTKYWLDQGCPSEKVILGVPFYGRSFTLADKSKTGLGAPTTGPGAAGPYTREGGMLGYNEICVSIQQDGWTVVRDNEHLTPYAYKDNQWTGYDDEISLGIKSDYIIEHNLGGAMLWSVETDDFKGKCGPRYPLLTTLNAKLRGGVPLPPQTDRPPVTRPPVTQPPVTQPPPPPSGICQKEGFVRDANDCSVFYQCYAVGGQFQSARHTCPNGLVFDPAITGCNYKDNVKGC